MPEFRTFSALDQDIESLASFLKDYLFVLPVLPLAERERFPRVQCVYFVVDGSTLYYIGCTKNLYLRWLNHHREEMAIELPSPRVYWFACPGLCLEDSFRLETTLIRELASRWNGQVGSDRRAWQRTELYSSGGTTYTRFRWGKGSESFGYVHIAGGAASHPVVLARRQQVNEAIAAGRSLPEILAILRGFSEAKRGRKPIQ